MINILFALIALGAMCIDIILNRGLIEEIDDESKEHKKRIEKLFKDLKLPKATQYAKASNDKIETLVNKLQKKVKDGCASNKARFFYFTIVVLSMGIIASAVIDVLSNRAMIGGKLYSFFWWLGATIWISILVFYVIRLCMLLVFNYSVECDRNNIRANVEQTIVHARLIVGDPTSPLD